MCRIFYNPNEQMTFVQADLCDFFNKLEKRAGGDGNGIYLIKNDKSHKTMKDSYSFWDDEDYIDGRFIFHTRLATHGHKKVYNVQPLVNCRYIIAHNGIFSQYGTVGICYGINDRYSDTHSILQFITNNGILSFYRGFSDKLYGVVLVYDKELDITYLCKSSGVFEAGQFENGEYLYGSSNLEFWGIENPELLSSGLYILNANGYSQIHTPTPSKRYGAYGYGGVYSYEDRYGWTWERTTGKGWVKKYKTLKADDTIKGTDIYSWHDWDAYKMNLKKLNPEDVWEENIDFYANSDKEVEQDLLKEIDLEETAKVVQKKLGRILTKELMLEVSRDFWYSICPKCLDQECGECTLWEQYLRTDKQRENKCGIKAVNCLYDDCTGCNYNKEETDERRAITLALEQYGVDDYPCGYAECKQDCENCKLIEEWQRNQDKTKEKWWENRSSRNWD